MSDRKNTDSKNKSTEFVLHEITKEHYWRIQRLGWHVKLAITKDKNQEDLVKLNVANCLYWAIGMAKQMRSKIDYKGQNMESDPNPFPLMKFVK